MKKMDNLDSITVLPKMNTPAEKDRIFKLIWALDFVTDSSRHYFRVSPVNETQVRTLYEGQFLANQTNLILVGGTGTGKDATGDFHRPADCSQRPALPLLQPGRSGQSA